MPLPSNRSNQKTRAFLLSMAVCVNILELFFPAPPFLPWAKPGFANAFTMTAIVLYGPLAGLELALLRSLVAGLLSGMPVTSLLLGGAGGVASALAMGAVWRLAGSRGLISLLGLGMLGAFVHTLTQLFIVYAFFVKNLYLLWQLPLLGPFAVVTGLLTGILASSVSGFLKKTEIPETPFEAAAPSSTVPLIKAFILAFISIAFFRIHSLPFQAALCGVLVSGLIAASRKPALRFILRFIPLFLVTLLLNAFSEPGHYFWSIPFITREGAVKGLLLNLRLINLLALSLLLIRADDLTGLLLGIRKGFPALSGAMETGIRGVHGIPVVLRTLSELAGETRALPWSRRFAGIRDGLPEAMARIIKAI